MFTTMIKIEIPFWQSLPFSSLSSNSTTHTETILMDDYSDYSDGCELVRHAVGFYSSWTFKLYRGNNKLLSSWKTNKGDKRSCASICVTLFCSAAVLTGRVIKRPRRTFLFWALHRNVSGYLGRRANGPISKPLLICNSGWLRPSCSWRRLTYWRMVLEAAGVSDVIWSIVNPTDEEEDEDQEEDKEDEEEEGNTAELLQIDNTEHWPLHNQENSLNKSQQQPSYLWPGLYFGDIWELCCYAIRSKH